MDREQQKAFIDTIKDKTDTELIVQKYELEEELKALQAQAQPINTKAQLIYAKLKGKLPVETPVTKLPDGVMVNSKSRKVK